MLINPDCEIPRFPCKGLRGPLSLARGTRACETKGAARHKCFPYVRRTQASAFCSAPHQLRRGARGETRRKPTQLACAARVATLACRVCFYHKAKGEIPCFPSCEQQLCTAPASVRNRCGNTMFPVIHRLIFPQLSFDVPTDIS